MNTLLWLASLCAGGILVVGCESPDQAGPDEWGTLELVTTTDGLDLDQDGYSLQVDGEPNLALPVSGTTTVPQLEPGAHTIALDGVSRQCYTVPALPHSLAISSGQLTRVTLRISCFRAYPLPFDLAFAVGGRGGSDTAIFIMPAADGSDRHTIRIPLFARNLSWSPDGTRLAFAAVVDSNMDIYSVLADGSDLRRLTTDPGTDGRPRWSPEGNRLLFTRLDANFDVYIMQADGSGQTNLTDHAADDCCGDWSPDGGRIVFWSSREATGSELYGMNSDGSGLVRLADAADREGTDWEPVWSPDGSEIAFWTQEPFNGSEHPSAVYRMRADGSDVRVVATGFTRRPLWSPDGTRLLAFAVIPGPSLTDGPFSVVYAWDLVTGERERLSGEGRTPVWSPDGGLVAFSRVEWGLSGGPLAIVGAHGGEVTDITAFPVEEAPAWRPPPP
jgi:dipeptidyl aminopeptidase/acylaminoacyl peptidase